MKHISVLKEEAINGLNIKSDGIYVDMTLGYAGHASEILKRLDKGWPDIKKNELNDESHCKHCKEKGFYNSVNHFF